jgi:hypothetical protein
MIQTDDMPDDDVRQVLKRKFDAIKERNFHNLRLATCGKEYPKNLCLKNKTSIAGLLLQISGKLPFRQKL